MQDNFVIHGVGKVVFYDFVTGREVLRLKRQESASWTFTYDETEVMGGDDLDVFELFETARAQSLTFVNNEFDFRMLEASTGKRVTTGISIPLVELDEGLGVPESPGLYTYTLARPNVDDSSVRVRYNDDREDMAPPPALPVTNITEINPGAGSFTTGTSLDIIITCVTPEYYESIEGYSTSQVTYVITDPVSADVEVDAPEHILEHSVTLPGFDVEAIGVNIYIDDGVNAVYKSNPAPIPLGDTHELTASPGAGTGAPVLAPTVAGQFEVSSGVVTFASPDAGAQVLIDYAWASSSTEPEVEIVDILKSCLRNYLKAIWRLDFRASDGTLRGMQMDVFKLKYSGDFNLEFNRADATAHNLEFKILDPGRADGKIVAWKIFPLGVDTGCQ